jgi:peptidoglycan/xylan/chitin deacetylase (PgdA/CDA1 family)
LQGEKGRQSPVRAQLVYPQALQSSPPHTVLPSPLVNRHRAAVGALAVGALALAACGSSAPHPSGQGPGQRALARAPLGCTANLVYASHGPRTAKVAAITFDDGPSQYTESLYKTLLRSRAAGTFFVIGERVADLIEEGGASAQLLREMVAHGMELGNHSYDHPRELPAEGEGASLQLELANREIERASGFDPCLFRPPYGNLSSELVQRAKVLGLTTVKWDVDPEDWRHPGAKVIRENVLASVKPGSIVVLHDNVETDGQTAQALPGIIAGLEARGYRLVTVTELLGGSFTYTRPPRRHGRLGAPVRSVGE